MGLVYIMHKRTYAHIFSREKSCDLRHSEQPSKVGVLPPSLIKCRCSYSKMSLLTVVLLACPPDHSCTAHRVSLIPSSPLTQPHTHGSSRHQYSINCMSFQTCQLTYIAVLGSFANYIDCWFSFPATVNKGRRE